MTFRNLAVLTFLLLTPIAACDVETEPVAPIDPGLSKAQAAAAGKADGFDYCAYFDWYGDGICDPFCLDPDPDCEGDNDSCPDVCGPVCAGEEEPEVPSGCPIPTCACDDVQDDEPMCPDVCGAVCAGEPEPELPDGCPTPACDCGQDEPMCPDVCGAVCAGEPEPELPNGCPSPSCQC